jgi:molybdopterin converting factor small subunit
MKVKIPSFFQPFTSLKPELDLSGDTVGEVMEDLFKQFPDLRQHFFTHWGILSANVLIYLNGDEIFTLQGLDTPLTAEDRITFVPTASGG